MLSQIGAAGRPAGDLVQLLLDCHVRIRSFCALASRLAEARDLPAEDVREAAASVRRYFVEALPLHAADEEESILPRLAGKDRAVDRALVDMHRDHREHGPLLDAVVTLCTALAEAPERHRELAPALGDAARALGFHFERHLAPEEATIFPALERFVSDEERRRIVDEIRARRAPRPQDSR